MYCPAAITFAWRRHDTKPLSRFTGPYWWKSAVLINIIMSWNLFSRFLPWYLPSVFSLFALLLFLSCFYTPRTTKLLGGYTGFTPSVRPSVCPSVRPSVRPSRMLCPLCIIYSYGWILFILGTNDHYHERVCRAPWPLTLTYIFKVIWPWPRKSCPLCSVYSSGWILSIFGTNDHYH